MTDVMTVEYVSERATAYGMPGVTVYGNDPAIVYDAVAEAVERARSGAGPTLLECLTYRRGGHKRDDPATYRDQTEVEAWLKTDPIPAFRQRLLDDARFDEAALSALEDAVHREIEDSVQFALNSPLSPPDSILEYLYA